MIRARREPAPRGIVIVPPLRLSPEFIDYPWLTFLGAAQAAAVLRARGWHVDVVNGLATPDGSLRHLGASAWLGQPAARFLRRLQRLRADLTVIAGSPFLHVSPGEGWLGEIAMAVPARAGLLAHADMFVGGMHYVEYDGAALLRAVPRLDLLLRYECEMLLGDVARGIESGGRPARGVLENRVPFPLDDLPLPDWDLLDVPALFAFLRRALATAWRPGPFPPEPAQTLPLVTARGCPHGCIFCSKNPGLPSPRRQVRQIPWARVEEAVERWVGAFGLRRLVVLDELPNLHEGRFERLLGLAERLRLLLEFPNGLRADRLREQHVRRLRPLTSALKVSLESASPRVQRRVLRKNLDPAAVRRVAAWCAAAGLPLAVHGMIGIPGERRSEIVRTVRMLAALHAEHGALPLLQFATPLPGTELARSADVDLRRPARSGPAVARREGGGPGGGSPVMPVDLHAAFQHGGLTTGEFDRAFLHRAARVLAFRVGTAVERKVIVNLTYRCNNHCSFCAVGDRAARDARTGAVLDALRLHRERGCDLVDIDGGEPTLHPDLFAVLEAARALGYRRIAVTTNGRLLSYARSAAALVRSGVTDILLSLHAPTAALQERLTNAPGSFRQTLAGIRNVMAEAAQGVTVAVNTTVVRNNVAALPRLLRLLAGLGVTTWNLQVVTPFGRARAAHVPGQDALRRHLGAVLERAPAGMRIQVINCPPCLLPGHEDAALTDFGKAERAMVFVGEAGVNLQAWLAKKRRRDARCRGCLYALVCPGFYCFESAGGITASGPTRARARCRATPTARALGRRRRPASLR